MLHQYAPEDIRPKFKQVGKIDLDSLGRKPAAKPAQQPKTETAAGKAPDASQAQAGAQHASDLPILS